MSERPTFEDVKEAVRQEVISATTNYGLVRRFLWPLVNPEELMQHYPLLLDSLHGAVAGNVVMTLSRLFEDGQDARRASLQTFLAHVAAGAGRPRPRRSGKRPTEPRSQDTWRRSGKPTDGWPSRENAYWAHADLTKRQRPELGITWAEVGRLIELAQKILGRYFSAYEGATQKFEVVDLLGWEPENFFKWARLDDYAAHRAKERGIRRTAIEDWARRRREGDPTAPDRPPI